MKNVSFLIAAYNSENLINKTIQSAEEASKRAKVNFEIIIIDDYSTDKTFKVLMDLKKKKNFLKVYRNKKNFGFSNSILKAAKKATGKNIKILHASNIESSRDIKEYLVKSKIYPIILTYFIDRRSFFRKILSRICSISFSLISGSNIRYFNSALLCNRKDFLNHYPKNFKGNFFLSVIISKLLILNYKYFEVKVYQKHPKHGSKAVSLLNLFSFFNALIIVFLFRLFK